MTTAVLEAPSAKPALLEIAERHKCEASVKAGSQIDHVASIKAGLSLSGRQLNHEITQAIQTAVDERVRLLLGAVIEQHHESDEYRTLLANRDRCRSIGTEVDRLSQAHTEAEQAYRQAEASAAEWAELQSFHDAMNTAKARLDAGKAWQRDANQALNASEEAEQTLLLESLRDALTDECSTATRQRNEIQAAASKALEPFIVPLKIAERVNEVARQALNSGAAVVRWATVKLATPQAKNVAYVAPIAEQPPALPGSLRAAVEAGLATWKASTVFQEFAAVREQRDSAVRSANAIRNHSDGPEESYTPDELSEIRRRLKDSWEHADMATKQHRYYKREAILTLAGCVADSLNSLPDKTPTVATYLARFHSDRERAGQLVRVFREAELYEEVSELLG